MNNRNKLKEKLAKIEHQRWADWQKYVFEQCFTDEEGNKVIPKKFVNGWQKQIDTPYEELSEEEKNADRREVDRYFHLIKRK